MPESGTPRTDGTRCDHSGMDVPEETGARFGQPHSHVNGAALAALVGAAVDGCPPCQGAQLDVVQADPLTVARLVEMSAVAMQVIAGGLPETMTETGSSAFSGHYRALLRAGVDCVDHTPMYEAAVALTHAERRQAAEDALDMLTGVVAWGG